MRKQNSHMLLEFATANIVIYKVEDVIHHLSRL